VPALQVVSRFVEPAGVGAGANELQAVADLLAGQSGCLGVCVGRAVDDPTQWLLTSEWKSVGAYRRALSMYDVKVAGVPILSQAVDEDSAFEVLYRRQGNVVTQATSARGDDRPG
jgi:hypothetical protein